HDDLAVRTQMDIQFGAVRTQFDRVGKSGHGVFDAQTPTAAMGNQFHASPLSLKTTQFNNFVPARSPTAAGCRLGRSQLAALASAMMSVVRPPSWPSSASTVCTRCAV